MHHDGLTTEAPVSPSADAKPLGGRGPSAQQARPCIVVRPRQLCRAIPELAERATGGIGVLARALGEPVEDIAFPRPEPIRVQPAPSRAWTSVDTHASLVRRPAALPVVVEMRLMFLGATRRSRQSTVSHCGWSGPRQWPLESWPVSRWWRLWLWSVRPISSTTVPRASNLWTTASSVATAEESQTSASVRSITTFGTVSL